MARVGGDEFVVVLEGAIEPVLDAVVPAVERALEAPMVLGSVIASPRSSIGVAVVRPGEHVDTETLLARADGEMYGAKKERRALATSAVGPGQDSPAGAPLDVAR